MQNNCRLVHDFGASDAVVTKLVKQTGLVLHLFRQKVPTVSFVVSPLKTESRDFNNLLLFSLWEKLQITNIDVIHGLDRVGI